MKLLILYFSGTGNTDYIARYIEKKLQKFPQIIEVKLQTIENYSINLIIDFQLYVVSYHSDHN